MTDLTRREFGLALGATAFAGTNLAPGMPQGWTFWSPSDALAPESSAVATAQGKALSLRARRFASFGRWTARVPRIQAGRHYGFEAFYRTEQVRDEGQSVTAMLSWLGADGKPVQRDYIDRTAAAPGGWRRVLRSLQAPERAASADIELGLRWTDAGSVLWRGASLVETAEPRPRTVRISTTRMDPPRNSTVEKNLRDIAAVLDRAAAEKSDLVLLTENPADRGTGLPSTRTAEPVPGRITGVLSAKAREHKMWIAMTLHEAADDTTYITCVLVDREGRIAGRYRKTHLPLAEGEEGMTPGSDYPVFDTDFGRVGLLVCWDYWFPEPARILRLKGAEIILVPLAGDGAVRHYDAITRARAIDNGVYFVTCSALPPCPSRIVNPEGEVIAETAGGIATASIDLNREFRLVWLSVGPADGEARSLYVKERRPALYASLADPRP